MRGKRCSLQQSLSHCVEPITCSHILLYSFTRTKTTCDTLKIEKWKLCDDIQRPVRALIWLFSLQASLDPLKEKAISWTLENYSMFAFFVFTESYACLLCSPWFTVRALDFTVKTQGLWGIPLHRCDVWAESCAHRVSVTFQRAVVDIWEICYKPFFMKKRFQVPKYLWTRTLQNY